MFEKVFEVEIEQGASLNVCLSLKLHEIFHINA